MVYVQKLPPDQADQGQYKLGRQITFYFGNFVVLIIIQNHKTGRIFTEQKWLFYLPGHVKFATTECTAGLLHLELYIVQCVECVACCVLLHTGYWSVMSVSNTSFARITVTVSIDHTTFQIFMRAVTQADIEGFNG